MTCGHDLLLNELLNVLPNTVQDKAETDKARAQKERADAGLDTPAGRKAAKKAAAAKAEPPAGDEAASGAAGEGAAQENEGNEDAPTSPAKRASTKGEKVHATCTFSPAHTSHRCCRSLFKAFAAQGKRKRAKEAKPADAAKQDDSISLEDLADRMDVDWKVRRNCHATHFLHKQWCFFLKFQPHVTMQGHVEHA
jgi:hypothetical protein